MDKSFNWCSFIRVRSRKENIGCTQTIWNRCSQKMSEAGSVLNQFKALHVRLGAQQTFRLFNVSYINKANCLRVHSGKKINCVVSNAAFRTAPYFTYWSMWKRDSPNYSLATQMHAELCKLKHFSVCKMQPNGRGCSDVNWNN